MRAEDGVSPGSPWGGRDYCRGCPSSCGDKCPYEQNALHTDDGRLLWRVVETCASQVRLAFDSAYAWDFPAVLTVGELLGADLETLAELLPALEPLVLRAWQKD